MTVLARLGSDAGVRRSDVGRRPTARATYGRRPSHTKDARIDCAGSIGLLRSCGRARVCGRVRRLGEHGVDGEAPRDDFRQQGMRHVCGARERGSSLVMTIRKIVGAARRRRYWVESGAS
jgi:hypothetical protein